MQSVETLRAQITDYIQNADAKSLEAIHALLGLDDAAFSTQVLPNGVLQDLREALAEVERNEIVTHAEMKKLHPQWFSK